MKPPPRMRSKRLGQTSDMNRYNNQFEQMIAREFSKSADCAYCGDELTSKSISLDHVVPRSKGGGNGTNNIVAACKTCNNRKADKELYLLKLPPQWTGWLTEWERSRRKESECTK